MKINVKQLVDEGATLDLQMKEIEKKLKEIKNKLSDHIKENFSDTDILRGISLPGTKYVDFITGVEKRQDADPEEALNALTKIKKEERFMDIIKVSATALDKVIGSEKSKELRPVVEIQVRQSFKIMH